MASDRPSPVALLRARHNLTRRQFARVLGVSVASIRGLERWADPPARHLALMERQIELHRELAAGWLAALARADVPENPRQLRLFEHGAKG